MQGSLEFSHDSGTNASSSSSSSSTVSKPGSRRPQHGIIEAGTLVGHLGLIYNRPRDATVTSKAGAVVWKFVTDPRGDGHQQPSHPVQTASQQLQVPTARFMHRISVPNHPIHLLVLCVSSPDTAA
jgi:hypothetical protein